MMNTPAFTLFPAIDLRGGQVVRLAQGDPARQKIYSPDPVTVAQQWQAAGATWLHVVNLDGAFGAQSALNLQCLPALCALGLQVQFGGGLRDEASVRQALELGATRVVLGTAAIENPALLVWAVQTYGPERVAVGLDVRAGRVQTRGWATATPILAEDLGQTLHAQGVQWCIFTDIARDGMSAGINLPATTALAQATGLHVIASGGVHTAADVHQARAAGLAGIIIGRALYEGHIHLPTLLAELS